MNQIENNKLIAEFMGLQYIVPINKNYAPYWRKFDNEGFILGDYIDSKLLYDSSWNWLMPAVEKIEAIGGDDWQYCITIERNYCIISHLGENNICEFQSQDRKIDNIYNAVVYFIQWYNEQKTKQ